MTHSNRVLSKRNKIVGYILLFVGVLMGLAEIAWYYICALFISPDLLTWLVEGLVALASIVLMLIGYRLIGGKWRRPRARVLRQRMRLVSLLLLLGYPFFLVLFVTQLHAVLWVTYWLFALPVWIAFLVISFVVGRRKKKQS